MLTQTLFVTIHGGDSGASLVSISSGARFALPDSGAGHEPYRSRDVFY